MPRFHKNRQLITIYLTLNDFSFGCMCVYIFFIVIHSLFRGKNVYRHAQLHTQLGKHLKKHGQKSLFDESEKETVKFALFLPFVTFDTDKI